MSTSLKTLVVFALTLAILAVSIASQAISPELDIYDRKVLVIQSYNRDYYHTRALEEGVVNTFNVSAYDVSLRYEFLDTKNHFDDNYFEHLYNVYKEKYADEPFDAIILCDDDALNFYKEYGKSLWPDVQTVVATGINSIRLYPDGLEGVVIIEERPNYEKTIDVALDQNAYKGIKTLHFIYDNTTTSNEVRVDIENLVNEKYSQYAHFHYYDKTPREIKDIVSSADSSNLFFFILYSRDVNGVNYLFDEVPRYALSQSANPVYALWSFIWDQGL